MADTDSPQQISQMEETDHPQENSGKKRIRQTRVPKEAMYGIELRRRQIRIRLMMAAGALVLLAILSTIAVVYPGTDGVAKRMEARIAETMQADVTLQGVDFSAFQANIGQLDASWPQGGALISLRAESLAANVMPQRYFGPRFGGDEMRAERARLKLQFPTGGEDGGGLEPAGRRPKIAFERYGVRKLEVFFGDPNEAASAMVRDAEAAFYPQGANGLPRVMLYSGRLDIPFWPELLLDRAIVELPHGSSRIISMRLRDGEAELTDGIQPGICDLSGDISHDPETASTLDVEFRGFELEKLIGADAGRIFSGRIDSRRGHGTAIVRVSAAEGVQMRAELLVTQHFDLKFGQFPFLRFLAENLGDNWFRNPMFDEEASMVLIRDGADISVEEINFSARHRMALRGEVAISLDGEISGSLEVGLAPGVIDVAITRRLDGMFSSERDGYRWVTLELGGTTDMPVDDFNAQFIEAPLPDTPLPLPGSTLPPAFGD